MGDSPEPMKRLEWPNVPHGFDDDELEDVLDPEGHWLPAGTGQPEARDPLTFDTVFRDDRRWAPQHGARGRSDTALPGAFLFPEPRTLSDPYPRERVEDAETAQATGVGRGHLVREIVETALLAILVFLSVRASVQHYRVEGASMDPSLENGEFLLVNSIVYSEVNLQKFADWVPFWDPDPPDVRQIFHGPERGDIVIVNPRQRDDRDLVKRIVGIPGDLFEIRNGTVFINGHELIEPYIKEPWRGALDPIEIPADFYFVMGDNRNNSADSRSFGLVDEDDIIGKAMASWWPKSKWGAAPNQEPKLAP
jgi:signal peptidase I